MGSAGRGGSASAAPGAAARGAAQQAEGFVHHEAAGDTSDEQPSSGAESDRCEDPERDLEQDVHQRQGDDRADGAGGGGAEYVEAADRGQEHADRGDQGEGLGDLDGEHSAEGFPPPAGDALGLRQCVPHQHQRRPGYQDHGESDPYDVGDQESDQQAHHGDEHEDHERPAGRTEHVLAQRLPGRVLVQTLSHHRFGKGIGGGNRLARQKQGQ
ncbi:hypothetical protein [Streptomyces sp. NPDC059479]|uniref:hypothetical protein n=1 Tax=Streptomyces sp. NPDC059479 TaxID=3346848 RepID=UPI003681D8B4